MNWHQSENISSIPRKLPVYKTHVWVVSKDNKYLLVSTDGINFDLPSSTGHSFDNIQNNLSNIQQYKQYVQTIVKDETGLLLSNQDLSNLFFLGYYVGEDEQNTGNQIVILSFVVLYSKSSSDLFLMPVQRENFFRFPMFMNQEEAFDSVQWLDRSLEYKALTEYLSKNLLMNTEISYTQKNKDSLKSFD